MADNSDEGEILESTFAKIQQGNDAEEKGGHWEAAGCFLEARNQLKELATKQERNQDGGSNNNMNNNTDEEAAKIAALYQTQSDEYFGRSRKALITAMLEEHEQDKKKIAATASSNGDSNESNNMGRDNHHYVSLADEELKKRLHLFASLYAREALLRQHRQDSPGEGDDAGTNQGENEIEDTTKNGLSSIEERLMLLNENLPKGFKTSEERMHDINRGLNRLGFSLYSAADQAKINKQNLLHGFGGGIKSESEQVNEIISQAADEVAMGITSSTGTGGNATGGITAGLDDDSLLDDGIIESDDSVSTASDDADDHGSELTPGQMERLRDHVAEAQAQLAQLLAMLSPDSTVAAIDGDVTTEESKLACANDMDKNDVQFQNAAGKRHLKLARKELAKACQEWQNAKGE